VKSVAGAGVVVTGAGSGIGAALATRFAAQGARVVVNDLDAGAAAKVADTIGGVVVAGDAASEAGVSALIEAAADELDGIDLYCANAGVGTAGGPEAAEADWELSWQVHVMAHVRAARLLLPGWLERGSGHFIGTASAAGLLTMLGTAPYSVTKHGAVAFAEWLRITYAHRGITVQSLCPLGVRTPMLASAGKPGQLMLDEGAIEPSDVADTVVQAIADGRFLILPHPEAAKMYAGRAADPDRWLSRMNQFQQRLDGVS
jgi:NAD(P)-dependent dehydrogenase (short-subunit alcohol dehydrogenase family)